MYLYFIQAINDGPIKIGVTFHPNSRIKQIQANSPLTLEYLSLSKGGVREEKELHKLLAKHRLHGEWFSPDEEVLAQAEQRGLLAPSAIIKTPPASANAQTMLAMKEGGQTLQNIAEHFQISRQRVHQILKNSS